MANVFYCRNEEDFKKVAIHIFKLELEHNCIESALECSKIAGCEYLESCADDCDVCGEESCGLADNIDLKDVYKKIDIYDPDVEYPLVVVYDSDIEDTSQYFSINEIKENTKYGIE